MRRVGAGRRDHADLLARLPASGRPSDGLRAAPFVDPAQQILELADLVDKGLLTADEFERQRNKVLEP